MALDVLVAKKRLDQDQADFGKAILIRIVSMLVGLIRSTFSSRVHEDSADYGTRGTESPGCEYEYDYDYDYD